MDDLRDAEDAVRALDGFKGWRVEISRNRGPPPKPGGFRGPPPPMDRYDDYRRRLSPRRASPMDDRRPRSPSPIRERSASPPRKGSPVRERSPPIRERSRSRSRSPVRD
ncbi:hypothetical protein GPECTOR_37g191 [Gonium pectorale]|uniref:Uncharacterized protein n=1 Tax=Gonium pectorale TaxID=33097 RepID=A0A150GC96_GONPE|nr:hypothetical protein GPECTOR_37g191 [Gonium pectorale]|eukprot:KXZ47185.1 hypothetical protein GPECTOR_37g191 [Gonium pectorale]